MKIIVYSKIIDLTGFLDKTSFIERFLNIMIFNNYYAEIIEDEINFQCAKDVTNLIFIIGDNYIPRILRSGKICFEYEDPFHIKVIWKIQFMPNILFSFLWAFLISIYHYFSYQNTLLFSILLFSAVFVFICLISYFSIKYKVKQYNMSALFQF
jgi:hypothetical protein